MVERLTEDDVEDLMKERKAPSGDLEWLLMTNVDEEKRLKVQILNSLDNELHFDARINKAGDITLLLLVGDNNSQIIRKFDTDPNHVNPDQMTPIGVPHKHTWTNRFKDKWAYVPNPPIDHTNRDVAVIQFLRECNIETDGLSIKDEGRRMQIQRVLYPVLSHMRFEYVDDSEDVEREWGNDDGI